MGSRASLYIIDHLRDSTLSVERIADAAGIRPATCTKSSAERRAAQMI
jgi:hypothetical protein